MDHIAPEAITDRDIAELAQLTGDRIVSHFTFEHLPPALRSVSQGFAALARRVVLEVPRNAERAAGLRKLLEAKDCAVRATREGA